jgi:hypothetical protein
MKAAYSGKTVVKAAGAHKDIGASASFRTFIISRLQEPITVRPRREGHPPLTPHALGDST